MPRMLVNFLVVAAAGALGAMARYGVGLLFRWSTYPLGTLLINLTGSFILGWFIAFADRRGTISDTWRLAIAVGFVGTYTTFSTFMWESDKLLREGAWLRASSYLAVSVFVGLMAVRMGFLLGSRGP